MASSIDAGRSLQKRSRARNSLAGTDWQGAILFGYGTGARLQDVANLRWESIDLENRVIQFSASAKPDAIVVIAVHPDFDKLARR